CCARAGGSLRTRPESAVLSALRRGWTPTTAPARIEHAGLVDHTTFELLTCNAVVRAALLEPGGALLDLGRRQRLATPTQRTALLARDGGCIIPGCPVPGDACDAHHVIWWSRGGPTDLDNLTLLCPRHHDETHHGDWTIHIRHGVPWVTPPTWIDRHQQPLRNATHHPATHRPAPGEPGKQC
ncbi:MAG TPA: HNH endonuclease signature motif containing protein, partial [Kineosporiaceae bacterium]|nr:HNH endonuclease signature motif containing protein [Kineosporiaceae bacterium]